MKRTIRNCILGIAFAALLSLAANLTGILWLGVLGVLVCMGVVVAAIWQSTDPDPADARVLVSDDEASLASVRMPWVQETINDLLELAQGPRLRPARFANRGAYFSPVANRIRVSRALCARLADQDLRLILAHEVAHATRRARTWCAAFREATRIDEELIADKIALSLVGGTSDDWARAVAAAQCADGTFVTTRELEARRFALGLAQQAC